MRIIIISLALVATSFSCIAQEAESDTAKPKVNASKSSSDESKPVKLEPQGEAHPPSIWMQQKLKNSQKIFVGMVEGDLVQVEEAARLMQLINRLESFVRADAEKGYRTQLRLFQYANEEILNGAKAKSLDRVTLGFNQLTVSCVACHKQLRNGG